MTGNSPAVHLNSKLLSREPSQRGEGDRRWSTYLSIFGVHWVIGKAEEENQLKYASSLLKIPTSTPYTVMRDTWLFQRGYRFTKFCSKCVASFSHNCLSLSDNITVRSRGKGIPCCSCTFLAFTHPAFKYTGPTLCRSAYTQSTQFL